MSKHIPVESVIEQHWSQLPPGFALAPKRVEKFDVTSGLFHAPIEYEYHKLSDISDEMPLDDWIGSALVNFVRGEFGTGSKRGECPPEPVFETRRTISQPDLFSYLESCEDELVYGGLVDNLIGQSGPDISDRVYALLCHPLLGHKDNAKHVTSGEFKNMLHSFLEKHLRLQFVFPSFPFKDQNPFRTEAPPGHVDLADLAMLIRLHAQVLALFQVHPYGADWVIVSDGPAYAPILNVSDEQAAMYRRKLLDFRNLLNIQGTVSILDLKDMTRRLVSSEYGQDIFLVTLDHVKRGLMRLIAGENAEIRESYLVLTRGMQWNMNHRPICEKIGWRERWTVLNAEFRSDCPDQLRELWDEIHRRSQIAALEYAAFNLTLQRHSVIARFLPSSLRGTIHPKRGQIGVPRLGDEYPWNGVAVVSGSKYSASTVSVSPLYKILRAGRRVVPHCINDQSSAPFCYELEAS